MQSNSNIRYLATAKQDVFNAITNKDSALPLFIAKYYVDILNISHMKWVALPIELKDLSCEMYYAKPYSEELVKLEIKYAQWGTFTVGPATINPPDD